MGVVLVFFRSWTYVLGVLDVCSVRCIVRVFNVLYCTCFLWMLYVCSVGVVHVFCACFECVQRVLSACSMGVVRVFYGFVRLWLCTLVVWVLCVCSMCVVRVFYGCSNCVFYRCCKCVLWVL